jgi:hypothetical protein
LRSAADLPSLPSAAHAGCAARTAAQAAATVSRLLIGK